VTATAAGVADPRVHLPVALGRRWGRETPGRGKYAEVQMIPSSRALLTHVRPPFVCISTVLLPCEVSGREERRIMLDHMRSLFLPSACPWHMSARPAQEPAWGIGEERDKHCLPLFLWEQSLRAEPGSLSFVEDILFNVLILTLLLTFSRFVKTWVCNCLHFFSSNPWS
jgi:hypothetical protein